MASATTRKSRQRAVRIEPGVIGPAYFREAAALIAEDPLDPAKMKETMLRYGLVPVASARVGGLPLLLTHPGAEASSITH